MRSMGGNDFPFRETNVILIRSGAGDRQRRNCESVPRETRHIFHKVSERCGHRARFVSDARFSQLGEH